MNCCTNTYDLGCFDSCDTITLPFAFEQNGTHKIQFETQFRFKYSITGVANEDVELDLTIFPENQFIYWRMINPDGTPFTYAVGSALYDCFSMRVDVYKDAEYTPVENVTINKCCKPKIYAISGTDSKVFNLSDWVVFGDIPTIDVYYKDGSDYITIPVQPVYNSMPTPTQITVTISGIPSDVWYIKLS